MVRVWLSIGALVLGIPALATAQPHDRSSTHDGEVSAAEDLRAQASFRAATAYYEAGDYENALRDFQTAYDLSRRPELLWNLYMCQERLGQFEQAAGSLESFIDAGAPGYPLTQVQARLENLRQRIARHQGGESDGAIAAEEPDGEAVPETSPAPSPSVDTTPVLAIVGFSFAGLGLIGFATFGGLTLSEDAALGAECGTHCTPARASTLDTYALIADISAAVSLVGAIVGVIGIFVAPSGSSSTATARVTPSVGPTSFGLSLAGSF